MGSGQDGRFADDLFQAFRKPTALRRRAPVFGDMNFDLAGETGFADQTCFTGAVQVLIGH